VIGYEFYGHGGLSQNPGSDGDVLSNNYHMALSLLYHSSYNISDEGLVSFVTTSTDGGKHERIAPDFRLCLENTK
jgi:hypothetical protein